jgi:hypothetical protein
MAEGEPHGLQMEEFLLAEAQMFSQQTEVLRIYQAGFEEVMRSLALIADRLEDANQNGPGPGGNRPTTDVLGQIENYRDTVDTVSRLPWDLEQNVEAQRQVAEAIEEAYEELGELIVGETDQETPQ